jgi:predicted Zn finger-like uncharacterized protein
VRRVDASQGGHVKFLCEQCKAKYQIADDKIVGRTVRMKCRKCGHLIEVRAAFTETSGAGAMPIPSPSQGALPPTGPSGGRAIPKAPPPRGTHLAASFTAPRAPAPKPDRLPSALAGAFKSNVQREEEVSAPFDMSELSPGSNDWYVAVNGVPVGPVRIAEIRRKAAMGAVTEDSLVWQEGLDEWRALRTFPDLVEIVREAAGGGRPSALPAPSSTPPPKPVSAWPPAPAAPAAPPSPQPPRAPVHAPAPRMGPTPLAAALAGGAGPGAGPNALSGAGRSNVVAITSRLATAERLEDAPSALAPRAPLAAPVTDTHAVGAMAPNPFAPPPDLIAPPAPVAPAFAADPFATGPAAAGAGAPGNFGASALGPSPVAVAPSVAPQAQPQKGPPVWILLILLVIAAAFGVTLAIAFAIPHAQPPQAVVVQVPVAAPPPVAQPQSVASAGPATQDMPNAAPAAPTRPIARAGNSTSPAAGANNGSTASNGSNGNTASGSNGRTLDLHGIGGGPTITPTDDPGSDGPKAAGSCISEGQIRQVIQLHQIAIQRTCWERNASTKIAVNVSVTATIAPDGTTQGATATGDDPAVAKCIENDVRGWHFPAMGCSQKIAVPFKFVRQ